MRCITHGWVVFYLIILSIILAPIGYLGETGTMISGSLLGLALVGLLGWWLMGFFSDCDDGYLGGLKRIGNPDPSDKED